MTHTETVYILKDEYLGTMGIFLKLKEAEDEKAYFESQFPDVKFWIETKTL